MSLRRPTEAPENRESLEELEGLASSAQTSSFLYSLVGCGLAIVASRFLPSNRFAPLAVAAPLCAYLDWREGEQRAAPYTARILELKKAAAKATTETEANHR